MGLFTRRNNNTSVALAGLIVIIAGCSDTQIAEDTVAEAVAASENQAVGDVPVPSSTPAPAETPAPADTPEQDDTPAPTDTPESGDTTTPADMPEPNETPAADDAAEPNETPAPDDSPEPNETPAPDDSPEPNETPAPDDSPEPNETPAPDDSPEPSDTPAPDDSPEPNDTPAPDDSPEPNDTPAPDDSPEPNDTPAPDDSPEPNDTPAPDDSPEPNDTPAPDDSPEPNDTPAPEDTPEPNETPAPDDAPEPNETPAPDDAPEPNDTPAPGESPEPGDTTTPDDTPEPDETPAPDDTPEPDDTTTDNEEEAPVATDNERAPGQGIAPDSGALLGANVAKETYDTRYDGVLAFEELLGRDIAIINRFHEFSAGVDSNFFWDRRHIEDGRTVMISWRATDNPGSINGTPDPNRARKIVAGQFDREIEAMAMALSDLQAPVLLRFNWEMDQDRGDPQYIGSTSEFIAAWRYVHDTFRDLGVTNVEWVWSPRARSFSRDIGQTFYPGHDYVDWIGGSAVPVNSFTDPQTIYSAWNEWASSLGKPQLLWVGLRENPDDSRWKANFIDELRQLTSSTWQGVKAIVYYNSDSPLGFDYTIDTSNQSLQSFRRLACDPHYTTTRPDC